MKRSIITLSLLVLVSLACGVQAQGDFTSQKPVTVISTAQPHALSVVTTGKLWVRNEPGKLDSSSGELEKGEYIQCVDTIVLSDGSRWCGHLFQGALKWSSMEWMQEVVNE
mgnify:CR=1 FL=1